MQTTQEPKPLGITVERARELYPTSPVEFKKLLEDNFTKQELMPNVMERIKDFNDILRETNTDGAAFNKGLMGLDEDEIAYRRCKLIAKAYNEGGKIDVRNHQQKKHFGWFNYPSGSSGFSLNVSDYCLSVSYVGARLLFLKEEHFLAAYKLFKDDYETLIT